MKIKKNDIVILTICIIVFGLGTLAVLFFPGDGDMVSVSVDGEVVSTYSLSQDGEYPIEGYNKGENTLLIEDGKARIIYANCPDKLCVNQKAISSSNETICCLPNRVIVEIISDSENEVDAIAR